MKGEKYLFVVSGPSGTGKDTVVASLQKKHPEIQHTVSATTRTPIEGEKDGINYHVKTGAEFDEHLAHDQIVLPPDMEELERRLRNRGTENEETIQRRLKRAETEIANSVNYDEHVVNVEVDSCAESIYSIIQFKLKHGAAE